MKKKLLILAQCFGLFGGAQASELFTLSLDVNGTTGSIGFNTVSDLFNTLNQSELQRVVPAYSSTTDALTTLSYRGLPMSINAVGAQVTLMIPGIVEAKVFNAHSTRDENFDDLASFFESDGGELLSAIQRKLAAVSPVDPIAGNPNSLQTLAVAGDFNQSFTSFASNIKTNAASQGADSSGLVALGLRFGSYSQAGLKSESVTLPLAYTFRGFGEGRQLTFSLPITTGKVGTATVFQAGLGLAYRQPMSKNWALTPAVGISAAGSADLGSVAGIRSLSLTSHYDIDLAHDWKLSVGNLFGNYSTLKVQSKDFSYDPGIKNNVYRNGFMLSQPVSFGSQRLAVEYSFTNTIFTGSELYNKWTNEYGVSLGTRKGYDQPSYLRLGVTLLQGQHSKGVSANFGYWF